MRPRSTLAILTAFLALLFTAGCACGQAVEVGPASASACGASSEVVPRVSRYEINARSYARGYFRAPGKFLTCAGGHLGDIVECVADLLLPEPVPEPTYAGAALAPQAGCAPEPQAAPYQDCGMVEQPYTVEETIMVPQKVQRTRVRLFRQVLVPAGDREVECAPGPQAAPRFSPCEPPGATLGPPPSGSASGDLSSTYVDPCCVGDCCGVPR